jgi:hypothetical protein
MNLDDWWFRRRVLKFRAKAERGGGAVSSRMIYAGSDDEGRYNLPASTSTIKNQLHFTSRKISGEFFVIQCWPCHVHDYLWIWLQICELFSLSFLACTTKALVRTWVQLRTSRRKFIMVSQTSHGMSSDGRPWCAEWQVPNS